jgi:hypothetical protein
MAWIARRWYLRLLGIAWLGSMLNGCALFDKNLFVLPKEGAESVHHIEIDFSPNVFLVDDSINPGVKVPCLKGRVYLINAANNGNPIAAPGWILAELFDTTEQKGNTRPPRIAQWDFSPDIVTQIEQRDKIGVGYTVFLPLEEYNPKLKKTLLRILYVDEKGTAREQNSALYLRIAQEEPMVQIQNFQNVPALMPPKR